MLITGKRHEFLTRHKIAFDEEGHLDALKMSIYVNAGHSLDVSMAVSQLYHIDKFSRAVPFHAKQKSFMTIIYNNNQSS
jgi:xanthine dehydrogenase molybdopterin-binding subunit B